MTQPWIAAERNPDAALIQLAVEAEGPGAAAAWNRAATRFVTLGQAIEVDEAPAFTFSGFADLNPDLNTAVDSEAANPLVNLRPFPFGQADSTDTAQALTVHLASYVALAQATETDAADTFGYARRFTLGQALEQDVFFYTPGDPQYNSRLTRGPYSEVALLDDPWVFWRLGEAAGSHTLLDSSGNGNDGTIPLSYGGGANPVSLGHPSLVGNPDTSLKFESSRPGLIESDDDIPASDAFTVELIIDPTAPDWSLQISRPGVMDLTLGSYTPTTGPTGNASVSFSMDGAGDDTGRTDSHTSIFTLPEGRSHLIFRYDPVDEPEGGFGPNVPRAKVFLNDDYRTVGHFILSHRMQDLDTPFEVALTEVASPLQIVGRGVVIDEFAYYLTSLARTAWQDHYSSMGDPADVITDDDMMVLGQAEETDDCRPITMPSLQEVALNRASETDQTFPWGFTGIHGGGYSSAVMVDGPELYWRLGETAGNTTVLDYSGHGHTGSIPAIYNPPSEPDPNFASLGYPGLVSGGDNAVRFTTPLTAQSGVIYHDDTIAGSPNFAIELIVRPWSSSYQMYLPWRTVDGTRIQAFFAPNANVGSTPGVLMVVTDVHGGVGGNTQEQAAFLPTIGEPVHFVFQVAGTPDVTIGTDPNRYRMEVWANGTKILDRVLADLPATYNFMTEPGTFEIAGYGVDIDEVAWYRDDLSSTRIAAHIAAMGTKATIGQAVETDSSVVLGYPRTLPLGQAPEDPGPFDPTDPAADLPVQIVPEAAGRIRPFLRTQFATIGQASHVHSARPITPVVEGSTFSGGTTRMGGTRITFPPRRLVSR